MSDRPPHCDVCYRNFVWEVGTGWVHRDCPEAPVIPEVESDIKRLESWVHDKACPAQDDGEAKCTCGFEDAFLGEDAGAGSEVEHGGERLDASTTFQEAWDLLTRATVDVGGHEARRVRDVLAWLANELPVDVWWRRVENYPGEIIASLATPPAPVEGPAEAGERLKKAVKTLAVIHFAVAKHHERYHESDAEYNDLAVAVKEFMSDFSALAEPTPPAYNYSRPEVANTTGRDTAYPAEASAPEGEDDEIQAAVDSLQSAAQLINDLAVTVAKQALAKDSAPNLTAVDPSHKAEERGERESRRKVMEDFLDFYSLSRPDEYEEAVSGFLKYREAAPAIPEGGAETELSKKMRGWRPEDAEVGGIPDPGPPVGVESPNRDPAKDLRERGFERVNDPRAADTEARGGRDSELAQRVREAEEQHAKQMEIDGPVKLAAPTDPTEAEEQGE